MKKELTIEHLAAYLPYGVSVSCCFLEGTKTIVPRLFVTVNPWSDMRKGVSIGQVSHYSGKLLLRPLSQLTEVIEHNGNQLCPIEWLEDRYYTLGLHKECERLLENGGHKWINHMSHLLVIHLLEWHFDIYGLLDSGLAEPIPSIEQP